MPYARPSVSAAFAATGSTRGCAASPLAVAAGWLARSRRRPLDRTLRVSDDVPAVAEQRLLSSYGSRGVNQARKRLAIERLVVRLQEQRPSGFIAKGGFAMEMRVSGGFRGTRDLDIAAEPDLTSDVDAVSDEIESACAVPVPDGFEFQLSGDPGVVAAEEDARTLRYLALARLDGRLFERVPLDVRVGDILDRVLPAVAAVASGMKAFSREVNVLRRAG